MKAAAAGAAGAAAVRMGGPGSPADVIFGGQSLQPRSPPQASIIKPATQVSLAKVSQRTAACPGAFGFLRWKICIFIHIFFLFSTISLGTMHTNVRLDS